MTMNVRSAVSDKKKAQIRLGVDKIDPDIIIITETWFCCNDGEFTIQGYSPITRCDRPHGIGKVPKSNGGGVLALAKNDIKFTHMKQIPLSRNIQIVRFVVGITTIFGIYRTGNAKDNHIKITGWLETEINKLNNNPFIITGDLNLPDLERVEFDPRLKPIGVDGQIKTPDHMWSELYHKHALVQHVDEATQNKGNILDYIFAPKNVSIPIVEVKMGVFDPNFDHYPVIFEIDCAFQRDNTPTYYRKETAALWKKFKEILDSTEPSSER
jgi:hypothetical protein